MIDIKKISSLSLEEIKATNCLIEVVQEAEDASELIFETYQFKATRYHLTVYSDGTNKETFSHDGIWRARYNNRSYNVLCTPRGIYEVFLAEYLVNNNYVKELEFGLPTEFGEKKEIAGYFRKFLARTISANKEK